MEQPLRLEKLANDVTYMRYGVQPPLPAPAAVVHTLPCPSPACPDAEMPLAQWRPAAGRAQQQQRQRGTRASPVPP